jgi:hypothetical protein
MNLNIKEFLNTNISKNNNKTNYNTNTNTNYNNNNNTYLNLSPLNENKYTTYPYGGFNNKNNHLNLQQNTNNKKKLEINIGPNVNIKLPKKINIPPEQILYLQKKINLKKKTELCKNWELYGDCFYKEYCSFAHGECEKRNKNNIFLDDNNNNNTKNSNNNNNKRNSFYSIIPCRYFNENIYCPFGNRCKYTHLFSNKRLLTYKAINHKIACGLFIEAFKQDNEILEFKDILDNVFNYSFKFTK